MKIIRFSSFLIALVAAAKVPFEERIYNGDMAYERDFPFQAGLNITEDAGISWCGGALISTSYVLTAAHCVVSAFVIDVYLGAYNLYNDNEESRKIIHIKDKSNIIVHKDFDMVYTENDIALIKLPEKVEITPSIEPVPLTMFNEIFSGQTVIASGWGKLWTDGAEIKTILRYMESKIIGNSDCAKYLRKEFNPTIICAHSSTGSSPCKSDSGGPLVAFHYNRPKLVGIISHLTGYRCESELAFVSSRVSSYLEWIANNTDIKVHDDFYINANISRKIIK